MKIIADLDEMVFENREKNYGAYQLRKKYNERLSFAMICTSVFMLLLVGTPFIVNHLFGKEEKKIPETPVVLEEYIPEIENKKEEKIVEELPKVEKIKQRSALIPEIVEDKQGSNVNYHVDTLLNNHIGFKNTEGETNLDLPFFPIEEPQGITELQDTIVENTEKEPNEDYQPVEKEPVPVNLDEIKRKISFPQEAKNISLEGKVIVRILVGKDGKYIKHKVLRSPHQLFTTAVEHVIPLIECTPAIQANKPVKCWIVIPFQFSLK